MKQLGVIIGRFQVAELSEAHRALIERALGECNTVLVLVGSTESVGTKRNPLSFQIRANMLAVAYPNVIIRELKDHPIDSEWAKQVDAEAMSLPADVAALYVGHQSGAVDAYRLHGWACKDIREVEIVGLHGAALRAAQGPINSPDFRAGMIYQTQRQFPAVYSVIDVLIYRPETDQVLLGRKANDPPNGGRLIGGFVDPSDKSFEMAVRREATEESGLEIGNIRYAGSATIDDWRYRGGPESVKSSVYVADRLWGIAQPSDDIAELFWCPRAEAAQRVLPLHAEILFLALSRLEKDRSNESVAAH